MKVSFSPDIIPNGWLGLKHQLTNYSLFSQSEVGQASMDHDGTI